MGKKIELLAPVGSKEALIPAIRMGANAIYLGSEEFSARRNATNFNREALKETVEYCHVRDVKVYLTVNTLIKDEEMSAVIDLVKYAAEISVDALIVQDIGLASVIKSVAPQMTLHASTQMSVHTPAGAEFLYDMGFSRVVLARELSKAEIEEIIKSCDIEVEVFVHGALCMSVSGQCYMSSVLGGRSGNRGLCAQPCRLPFKTPNGTGHDLSLKDNSIIEYIEELSDIGVDSIKIEGRMKRPEYVAAAVNACRLAVDNGKADRKSVELLSSVFARSGFTNGYYTDNRGLSMFGIRSKEDVLAATGEVFSKLHEMYKAERQVVPLDFNLKIKKDLPVSLKVCDNKNNFAYVEGIIPEKAINKDIDEEKCISQLKKTGGTPFYSNKIVCDIDKGLSIPMSSLNSIRREAISIIEEKRKSGKTIKFSTGMADTVENKHITENLKLKIRARFPHCDIPDEFKICELIYVTLNSKKEDLISLKNRGFNIALEIPRAMFGKEKPVIELLKRAKTIGIEHVWAGNIGAVQIAADLNMKIHGGYSLNLMNTRAMEWAEDFGLVDTETSFEMTLNQISHLGGGIKRGIIAYGRLPMMLTRNCPAANAGNGCIKCKKHTNITDRKGIDFPIMCSYGCTEILNSVPLYMADRTNEIKGVEFIVLRFSVENSVESVDNLKCFNSKKCHKTGITRGLYYRNVE